MVAKKQDVDDQDWATWSPPATVFQPKAAKESSAPKSGPLPKRQALMETSQPPERQKLTQEGFPVWKLHGRSSSDAPRIHNRRNATAEVNHEDQGPNFRTRSPLALGDRDIGNDSNWQGLRRRRPAIEAQRGWKDHRWERSRSDDNYRNENRMRRLEASKKGEYVGLGGLQRRKGRPFQDHSSPSVQSLSGLDTGSSTLPQPGKQHVATSPYAVASSETGRPMIRKTTMTPGSSSDGNWARYEPQAAPQAEPQRPEPSLFYSPRESGGSSTVARSSFEKADSESPSERTAQESISISRPFDSSWRKSRPEGEIQVPLARGRGAGNLTKESSTNRRKERKRSVASRNTEDDVALDDDELAAKRAARKQKIQRAKERERRSAPPTPLFLPEFISVSNLAGVLKVRVEEFLQKMEGLGFEDLTNDHVLDAETAGLVAAEYNFEPIIDRSNEHDLKAQPPAEDKSNLPPRPPVVTIMGHVDHGKTTLLDFLRKSSVAASEHGGITQHIGAFSVPMSGGRLVTFLDTPGHAAFLSMRQRGANVTDIVILVVAADDSVKPQTIEAIKHAQSAKVPIIVAVNKIDKEDARPEQVKQDLARYGVEIEDFGGDAQVVCVSGKTGQGMSELEDAAVALADILDMRAPTDGLVEGWVLEATTKRAGRIATVLVRRGTIRPSDVIVAGTSWARVRSLRNEAGVMVESAGPGTPVEIDGWREQPAAGDEVLQSPNNSEQKAKSAVEYRLEASQREQLAKDVTAVNEARRIEQDKREQLEKAKALFEANADRVLTEDAGTDADAESSEGQKSDETPRCQEVFFILKADVSGSVEAIDNAVTALGNSEVRAHILRSGVGPITEFDIDHAAVAAGHIINFNTPVDGSVARLAEERGVGILDQSIIYRLIDQVKSLLAERLPRLVTKRVLGEAEIAQVFDINVKGRLRVPVAGCRVRNGEISRRVKARVLREGKVVFDGMSLVSSSLLFLRFLSQGLVDLLLRR